MARKTTLTNTDNAKIITRTSDGAKITLCDVGRCWRIYTSDGSVNVSHNAYQSWAGFVRAARRALIHDRLPILDVHA